MARASWLVAGVARLRETSMNSVARHVIPGSDRRPLPGAVPIAPVRDDEQMQVTVRLRRAAPLAASANGAFADVLPARRTYPAREDFARQHGASTADIAAVTAFAQAHGLAVAQASAARR